MSSLPCLDRSVLHYQHTGEALGSDSLRTSGLLSFEHRATQDFIFMVINFNPHLAPVLVYGDGSVFLILAKNLITPGFLSWGSTCLATSPVLVSGRAIHLQGEKKKREKERGEEFTCKNNRLVLTFCLCRSEMGYIHGEQGIGCSKGPRPRSVVVVQAGVTAEAGH